MADSPAVQRFNEEVVRLLKAASEKEVVAILQDKESILRLMHNNVNNNREQGQPN